MIPTRISGPPSAFGAHAVRKEIDGERVAELVRVKFHARESDASSNFMGYQPPTRGAMPRNKSMLKRGFKSVIGTTTQLKSICVTESGVAASYSRGRTADHKSMLMNEGSSAEGDLTLSSSYPKRNWLHNPTNQTVLFDERSLSDAISGVHAAPADIDSVR